LASRHKIAAVEGGATEFGYRRWVSPSAYKKDMKIADCEKQEAAAFSNLRL
jgi:hypothetical protein